MPTLMYDNTADDLVTRQELAELVVPEALGPRHFPYSFAEFVDHIDNAIVAHGHEITNQEFAVTKDGQRLFGLMAVRPNGTPAGTDWGLTAGLRGSHDQAVARGITLGSQVMVCSNLCFHGDLGVWRSLQTKGIVKRMPELISDAIGHLPAAAQQLTVSFDDYRMAHITRECGQNVLCELYRKGGLTGKQLAHAVDEWDEPSHDEHAADGLTAWRLFNAATEALKPTGRFGNPLTIQRRSEIIHGEIDRLVA